MSLFEKEKVADGRVVVRLHGGPFHLLTGRGWQRQEQIGVSECGMPLLRTDYVADGPQPRYTFCVRCLTEAGIPTR